MLLFYFFFFSVLSNNNNNGIATAFITTTTPTPFSSLHHSSDASSKRQKNTDFLNNRQRKLFMTTTTIPKSSSVLSKKRGEQQQSATQESSSSDDDDIYWNGRYVGRLLFNQIILGSSIWIGGVGYEVLVRESDFASISSFVYGIIGVIPLLLFSYYGVETSESPYVSNINVSTNRLVLQLLGSKKFQPIVAFLTSLALASITGLAEEVLFRGQVLPSLGSWSITQGWTEDAFPAVIYGTILSTIIFSALHINPTGVILSLYQQVRQQFSEDKDENDEDSLKALWVDIVVLFGFQCVTGLTFALCFIGTGGNLAVPIITHTLYDFYTFYKTHYVVTTQMEYATALVQPPEEVNDNTWFPSFFRSTTKEEDEERRWSTLYGTNYVKDIRTAFYYYMDTNRDGVLSRKELRIALNSYYDVNLTKQESQDYFQTIIVDTNKDAIEYKDFLKYVGRKEQQRRRGGRWNTNQNSTNQYTTIQKAFQEDEKDSSSSPFFASFFSGLS